MITTTAKPADFAAVYRRTSTGEQDLSITAQEERATAYLALQSLATAPNAAFSDPDITGTKNLFERPEGKKLLWRLDQGDIKHLVVCKIDRLGRSARNILEVFELLENRGVTLHIVDFGGSTITSNGVAGKLFITMLAAFAEFEVGMIQERTKQVLDSKRDKGELVGKVPYGFDVTYTFARSGDLSFRNALSPADLADFERSRGKCSSKTITPNDEEQVIIRQMLKWRWPLWPHKDEEIRGGMSMKAIAHRLTDQGVATKLLPGTPVKGKGGIVIAHTSGAWSMGTVDGVLHGRYAEELRANALAKEESKMADLFPAAQAA